MNRHSFKQTQLNEHNKQRKINDTHFFIGIESRSNVFIIMQSSVSDPDPFNFGQPDPDPLQ